MVRAALLSLLLLAGPVRAAEVSDEGKAQARALMQEGARHYSRGDYEAALEKFQAAHRAFANPRILFNMGQAYRGLGRYVESIEAFQRFLTEATEAPATARASATKAVDELRSKVAFLEISCGVAGAEVSLDGQPKGTTPLPGTIAVLPGPHQLLVEKAGSLPFTSKVLAARGARQKIEVVLEPIPVAPPPRIVVAPPPPPVREEPAAMRPALARKLGAGLAVGGVAAIGAGLVFGAKAHGDAKQIMDRCAETCSATAIRPLDQQRQSHGRLQWIFLGTGAAALAGATAVFLLWGREQQELEVQAALAPGGGGVRVGGRW
jgi:hypothetical protein